MSEKSLLAVFLVILLALAAILGLPLMVGTMERQTESVVSAITASPAPPEDAEPGFVESP